VDTVYATVGRKPALLREVLETAISCTGQAATADQQDTLHADARAMREQRVRAAPTAQAKLETYVGGLVELQPRLAPVYLALRDAAGTDADSAALWQEITARRAANMRRFAADLRSTGEPRPDLSDDDVADLVWSMNGPECWTLLVGDRGWTPECFRTFLVDAWRRLLLVAPNGRPPARAAERGRR
jgi:hypothetical protein